MVDYLNRSGSGFFTADWLSWHCTAARPVHESCVSPVATSKHIAVPVYIFMRSRPLRSPMQTAKSPIDVFVLVALSRQEVNSTALEFTQAGTCPLGEATPVLLFPAIAPSSQTIESHFKLIGHCIFMNHRCSKAYLVQHALPNLLAVVGVDYSVTTFTQLVPELPSDHLEPAFDIVSDGSKFLVFVPKGAQRSGDDNYPAGTKIFINKSDFKNRVVTKARVARFLKFVGGAVRTHPLLPSHDVPHHRACSHANVRDSCVHLPSSCLPQTRKLLPAAPPFSYFSHPPFGPPATGMQVTAQPNTKLKAFVKRYASLSVCEKKYCFVDGKVRWCGMLSRCAVCQSAMCEKIRGWMLCLMQVQLMWVSDTKEFTLRGSDVASVVARHLDGNLNILYLIQRLEPTARPGRPRKNAPALQRQPPELLPVDRLTGPPHIPNSRATCSAVHCTER